MEASDEGFIQLWNVYSKLFVYLQKKGVDLSPSLIEDIRIAKTIIHMMKYDPNKNISHVMELEKVLFRINSEMLRTLYALDDEAKKFWEKKINNAMMGRLKEDVYIPKPPSLIRKGKKRWVRIRLLPRISRHRVQEICLAHDLDLNFESEDIIVIEGEEKRIKDALNEIKFLYSEK
ncbi:MAG: DUF2096 family protein [Candidatus Hydrothermarchaeota archaeon]